MSERNLASRINVSKLMLHKDEEILNVSEAMN